MGAWGNDAAVFRGTVRGDGPPRSSPPLAARHDPRPGAPRSAPLPPRGRCPGGPGARRAGTTAVTRHGRDFTPTLQATDRPAPHRAPGHDGARVGAPSGT